MGDAGSQSVGAPRAGPGRAWTGAFGCGRLGGIMSGSLGRDGDEGVSPVGRRPAQNLRPWRPGQSGNPRGRSPVIAEVQALARQHTVTAVETLVHIMLRGKSESARAAAASTILDRGWGRAPLTVTGPDGERVLPRPEDLVRLSDIQLARVIAVVTEVLDDGAESGEPRALPP
jgi:hypothetical protein